MKNILRVALSLALAGILLWTGVARAQEATPQNNALWTASYWNNTILSGTPALQTTEIGLTHLWSSGSPYAGVVAADQFSARWTTSVDLLSGTYRFATLSDDGIRVWVDSTLIIDNWTPHGATLNTTNVTLTSGWHTLKVDYYEQGGDASAALGWQPIDSSNILNWRGEYFNNPNQSGAPAFVRDDASINFDWGTAAPVPNVIQADQFSVRWTRSLTLNPGTYRFRLTIDDGGKLVVGGQTLINRNVTQPATTYIADYDHAGGGVSVQLDYFDNTYLAVARLTWERTGVTTLPDDLSLSKSSGTAGTSVVIRTNGYLPNTAINVGLGTSPTSYSLLTSVTTNATGALEATLQIPANAVLNQEWFAITMLADGTQKRLSAPFTVTASTASTAPPANALVIDNQDKNFVYAGSFADWEEEQGGYANEMLCTLNTVDKTKSYEWARWYFQGLTAGRYEVYAYIPFAAGLTHAAPYWVHHLGGYTKVIVDQSAHQGEWLSLGTYWFDNRPSMRLFVSLSDVTGEPTHTTEVMFDAVALVKR